MITAHDLCGPDPRPMTCGEVDYLYSLALRHMWVDNKSTFIPFARPFINIGADQGVSTLAMLEATDKHFTRPIFSIDVLPCPQEIENCKASGLNYRRVIRILGKSADVGWSWVEDVNLIFVDGDHSEEGVREDINNWCRHLPRGGVIIFHDYIPDPIPSHIMSRVAYAVDKSEILRADFDLIGQVERLIAFERR